ncbi:MAG TPA: TonB C-terminal domain-containing protein [Candidatus Polarisedimenticolaceae bacterium]|nr:TonB C-terminal domain-containing protein [Candidatus Polarisedimenticolaceae bacterium]
MSRWLRIQDLEPDPEPPRPEPAEPLHLPRPEDPFTVRSRRTAEATSAVVHLVLILLVLLLPRILPESITHPRRPTPAPEVEKLPITFQEFRPPPRPQPQPQQAPRRGEPEAPRTVQPTPRPDRQPAGTSGPRPERGPDQGQIPPPGGSVLPPESGPAAPSSPAARPGSRPFDLDRALQDFRRAAPPADPREGPPAGAGSSGQGKGRGVPMFGTTGFGVGNLEFESRDFDWTDYYRQIYLAILTAWYSRLYQTEERFEKFALDRQDWSLDHSARIRFTILRSGQVVNVSVEGESGCVPLDDSAVDALREVVLPPLPQEFKRDRETVHGRFIATGDIRQMRRTLDYYRARGMF